MLTFMIEIFPNQKIIDIMNEAYKYSSYTMNEVQ